jgi:hypothetical protein
MRGGGSCGVSANEYSCTHGAQINFGDLTPYITYAPSLYPEAVRHEREISNAGKVKTGFCRKR